MSQPLSNRLLSLDVFRGATVAAMILVNNPGDWGHIYAPLEHSAWHGCTFADLIFPSFLFMVGVSIVYAMETRKAEPANHSKMIWTALRRALILIALSLATQLLFHPGLATLRLPGVLQRIALVFFICTILYLKTSQRFRNWLIGVLLVGYYLLLCFAPVPGQGAPDINVFDKNIGAWLDRVIFTSNHLWVFSKTWDPEGLLGTLPAIATGLIGIRAGTWLKRKDKDDATKVSWLSTYGFIAIVFGLIWSLFFPINKALWTSSFVLYTGGFAQMILAACYWLIDVRGYKKYTGFFVHFGVNAITAYMLSMYVPHYLNILTFDNKNLYDILFNNWLSPVNASLAMAVFWLFVVWLIMWFLYRKKVIIKV